MDILRMLSQHCLSIADCLGGATFPSVICAETFSTFFLRSTIKVQEMKIPVGALNSVTTITTVAHDP